MIIWLAPLALALFAVLPMLWWLHRRRPKPAVVTVASLMFLEDEVPEPTRRERRRIDADLLLALAAAATLSVAAAGPVLLRTSDGRRVTVLVDTSPAMAARSAEGTTASERASARAGAIERLASGRDRIETIRAEGAELARRLSDPSIGLRVLISDRRPRELPVGVSFVGVGDPAGVNAGIVSIDVDAVAGRRRVSVTIWNDAATPRSLRAGPINAETEVDCPAFGAARASWDLGPIKATGDVTSTEVQLIDERGALDSDDRVVLDPRPLRVAFSRTGLAPAVETATRRALDAVLVGGWKEGAADEGGLFVGPLAEAPKGASLVLEIGTVPPGVEPVRPGEKDAVSASDVHLGRDLDLASVEWVYPPGPDARAPWRRITSYVDRPELTHFSRLFVRWHADPSRGRPAAIDTPLWPLFIENAVRAVGGAPKDAGHRWSGVLDPDVTRLGRDVVPFDESFLAAAPRDVLARRNGLAPWFAAAGAICIAALWCGPRKVAVSPVR